MDLALIEMLLEDMNRQTNQLIDLVRGLQKGEVFGEPLTASIKNNLASQAKAKYGVLKTTFDSLAEEVNK